MIVVVVILDYPGVFCLDLPARFLLDVAAFIFLYLN